jgi:phospho-N-acetylmuramoyl-pentapeptide-transferase
VVALLIAACLAGGCAIFGTKALMNVLIARRVGQPIHEDVPEGHTVKAGTPTMGGIAIVASAVVGYLAAHVRHRVPFTYTGLLVMGCITAAGVVGFLDDWIKVSNERNAGLSKTAKTVGLLLVAVLFAIATVLWTDVETTLSFTRYNSPGWDLTNVGWCAWAVLLIYATTNGVNFSDGLDGLAAGSATLSFSCLMAIGFWTFRHPEVYHVNHALDLAVAAAAMVGACAGFLWWNAAPARIFMGDTGSLAIGAGLACIALTLNVQLLLGIIGALYVIEVLSVVLQVTTFRLLKGRRILRMAPIHHHFELGGWPETTILVRFWLLAGACVGIALGLFYADFVGMGGLD